MYKREFLHRIFRGLFSGSALIGGPSAGGATSLLTYAVLEDIELNPNFTMTGAISSGGIITPVDGIIEKITAGDEAGKSPIAIPELSLMENNLSQKIAEINNTINATITPVILLQEALSSATGKPFTKQEANIIVPEAYSERMTFVEHNLCQRAEELLEKLPENATQRNQTMSFLNRTQKTNDSYSKASLCFSANIPAREYLLSQQNQTQRNETLQELKKELRKMEEDVDKVEIITFSDLEVYAIVKERLLEADTIIKTINESNISSGLLAAATERTFSAYSWGVFFGMPGTKFVFDKASQQSACSKRIEQAETRMNYLRVLLPPEFFSDLQEEMFKAYEYRAEGEPALCLFKASRVKARADTIITSLSLTNETISLVVDAKRYQTSHLIESQKGAFPILGYSYYEYSGSLLEDEPASALLFADYALSFSDLSGYFHKEKRLNVTEETIYRTGFFIAGIIVGLLLFFILRKPCVKTKNKSLTTRTKTKNEKEHKKTLKQKTNKTNKSNKTKKQTKPLARTNKTDRTDRTNNNNKTTNS